MSFKKSVRYCNCGKRLVLKSTRDLLRKKYCSRRCRQLARWERGELTDCLKKAQKNARFVVKKPVKNVVCEKCLLSFLPTSPRQFWCPLCCPTKSARARLQRYNLSQPEFDRMLKAQGGVCAICRLAKAFNVDHDHTCCSGANTCGNCIRGLLCFRCNLMISFLEDEPELLVRAWRYLGE